MIGNIQLVHSMVQMVVHVKKGGEVMNKNKFVSVMKLHGDTQEKSSKGHLLVIIQTVQGKKVAHFAGVGLVERIQVLLLMLIH